MSNPVPHEQDFVGLPFKLRRKLALRAARERSVSPVRTIPPRLDKARMHAMARRLGLEPTIIRIPSIEDRIRTLSAQLAELREAERLRLEAVEAAEAKKKAGSVGATAAAGRTGKKRTRRRRERKTSAPSAKVQVLGDIGQARTPPRRSVRSRRAGGRK
ncbi:hypothetical protein C2E23DRAFT_883008 [Lenzites betulinus]|nr:hypothetical protein C2E23DRAFT_883008 [Lenzites betulinus]